MQQITNTSPVTVGKTTTLKIFKISSNSVCVESAASKNCAFFVVVRSSIESLFCGLLFLGRERLL
jgi:hypothetical protein